MDDDALPTVVHTGTLQVTPDLVITVHVLSDGQRIIPAEDFVKFLHYLEATPGEQG